MVYESAEATIRSFAMSKGINDVVNLFPNINIQKYRTIEEFEIAWSRVCRLVEETCTEKQNGLPMGQPSGMVAFANNASFSLVRARLPFMPLALFPQNYVGETGVWTIVTIEKLSDSWHVCFTHRGGRPGIGVVSVLERLASKIYHEITFNTAKGFLADLSKNVWKHKDWDPTSANEAQQLYFYEHVPADSIGTRSESFAQIIMKFEGISFKEPKWNHYHVIPSAIQPARFALAFGQAIKIAELE